MSKLLKLLSLLVLFVLATGGRCALVDDRATPDLQAASLAPESAPLHTTAVVLVAEGPVQTVEQPPKPEPIATGPKPIKINGLTLSAPLAGRARLWEMVFGDYDSSNLILYHRDHPEIVYGPVRDLKGRKDRAIARVRSRLYTLNDIVKKSQDPLAEIKARDDAEDLLELFHKFDDVAGTDRFAVAARRDKIAVLRGRKNELIDAHRRAEPYLAAMEKVFSDRGMPPALTRIVFVESMFIREAESSKGAVGVWQLTESAARPYLVMSRYFDQRRDPMAGTRAAAAILEKNFDRFGSWPLAVTAYNAGAGNVKRALNRTGKSKLPEVLDDYDHGAFGFAVENFYARLIGVLLAEEKLGLPGPRKTRELDPLAYDSVSLPAAMNLSELSDRLGMDSEMLVSMNPAWTAKVEQNKIGIPSGYLLRVPAGSEPLVRLSLGLPVTAENRTFTSGSGLARVP